MAKTRGHALKEAANKPKTRGQTIKEAANKPRERNQAVRKTSKPKKSVKTKMSAKTKNLALHAALAAEDTAADSSDTRQAKPKDAAQVSRTGFLSLSGELRNVIYQQTLVYDEKIVVGWGDTKKKRQYQDPTAVLPTGVPALLQVCRQIREEGLSVFYSENTFVLHYEFRAWELRHSPRNFKRFMDWCAVLGHNIRWLKKIRLCFSCTGNTVEMWRGKLDILPLLEFAVDHSDVSIEVTEVWVPDCWHGGRECICVRPALSGHSCVCEFRQKGLSGCCCTSRPGNTQLCQLADMFPILKSPEWIDEIRSGNIARLLVWLVTPPGLSRPLEAFNPTVCQVTYGFHAAHQLKDKENLRFLCQKLSLPYCFDLRRQSLYGTSFVKRVEAKSGVHTTGMGAFSRWTSWNA
ncbi:hypothetical protein BU16DRAFT_617353 [Lophium mytilinum]|uniref:Uncharacterized protein n=1 Tax=Lophium mytilinum TaxID=390894 RepID=A0A6A6QTU2_9PEZI|nr:hypothetical protein BU16DRAFT_617353 [Lophium mytilinum]